MSGGQADGHAGRHVCHIVVAIATATVVAMPPLCHRIYLRVTVAAMPAVSRSLLVILNVLPEFSYKACLSTPTGNRSCHIPCAARLESCSMAALQTNQSESEMFRNSRNGDPNVLPTSSRDSATNMLEHTHRRVILTHTPRCQSRKELDGQKANIPTRILSDLSQ